MKTAFSALIILLFSTLNASAQTYWEKDPRAPHFCMQNFNAYGPIYASGVVTRTENIVAYLKSIPKCDVVHLQEVWNDGQIAQVEKSLSSQYNISAPNRDSRNGIMSFFMGDILGRQTVEFNVNKDGSLLDKARGVLSVKKAYHVVKSKFYAIDEELYFINTHLHPMSQSVRLTQILDLLQWRLKNQDAKMLLSGDFNADIASLERKALMLTLGMHDSMEEALGGYPINFCTYCHVNPLGWTSEDHTFDYIFFSNVGPSSTALRAASGEVNMKGSPQKPWSDHYGVRVEFFVESNSEATADIEARREKALQTFKEVEAVLKVQKGQEFKPYLTLVKNLTAELEKGQGSFNDYFESYR